MFAINFVNFTLHKKLLLKLINGGVKVIIFSCPIKIIRLFSFHFSSINTSNKLCTRGRWLRIMFTMKQQRGRFNSPTESGHEGNNADIASVLNIFITFSVFCFCFINCRNRNRFLSIATAVLRCWRKCLRHECHCEIPVGL